METLAEIQQALKAPKGQVNKFGNYNYRSCEDILTAVKPLLGNWSLVIFDEIVEIGGRVYVKATARIEQNGYMDDENNIPKLVLSRSHSSTGFAREALTKKGMDEAQITGSASSYARKYALNGLFAIDDTKDPDSTNTHGKSDDSNSLLATVLGKCQKAAKEDADGWAEFKDNKSIEGPETVRALSRDGLKKLNKDLDEFLK